ncbi:S-layer homology domain-containing protein [Ureibacillus thermosphaericus]|uniref:S-layer homology domain-containing protein n=1 Tax=Ureibacillus thermosphaericus TaxID=51173 RepID=UPI0030C8DD96
MKKKKWLNLFTAATAVTIAATAVPVATSAAQFSDIKGDTHEQAIVQLVDAGIIKGYPEGTFRAYQDLTCSDVVKLIGRFVKKQGYEIPSDYKTNMRFLDLSKNMDDELLQYAALVKDAGIFEGNRLNPTQAMTREDMAVILANTLSKFYHVDVHHYVDAQSFEIEVTDIQEAKESARSSIQVLDYFNITNVKEFKPKATLKRGQFASFLQRLINTTLTEKLFQVKTVEVVGNEIVVQFNEAVNLPTTTSSKEIATYFKLVGLENEVFAKGELNKEGDSYTITLNSKNEGNYRFEIQGVPSKSGKILPAFDKRISIQKTEEPKEETRFVVESEKFVLGVTPDGQIVDKYAANIKVYGFVNHDKVELPSSAYTITTNSKYLNVEGNKVTVNVDAIEADGILDEENQTYKADIFITINQTGEQIKHTLTLSSEKVKVNGKFVLINKNSLSQKELKEIDIEVSEYGLVLTATDLFKEIYEEGYFEIEDQYGKEANFNPNTGLVTFADGSSREIRPIITNINTTNDQYEISYNGTINLMIGLGEKGLSRGDSFNLKLSIDDATVIVKVYMR